MKRACVLGHRGMLGHLTARVLESAGWTVQTITARFEASQPGRFVEAILSTRPAWCINCIGLRPGTQVEASRLLEINGHLPQECLARLPREVGWIQASTDGVYEPSRPKRRCEETPDAQDDYGKSKILGEQAALQAGRLVVRCSVIGPELGPPRSLMGWFLSQTEPVLGFINQMWNGITTLQWAQICVELMESRLATPSGILQPGTTEAVSKYDLLRAIKAEWNHPVEIRPATSNQPVWRTLEPNFQCPPVPEQLRVLREWGLNHHID